MKLRTIIESIMVALRADSWLSCTICGERHLASKSGTGLFSSMNIHPVCDRPACNHWAGFMEARRLYNSDPEGRVIGDMIAADVRSWNMPAWRRIDGDVK